MNRFFIISMCLFAAYSSATSEIVEHLAPCIFDPQSIVLKSSCDRPNRKGGPNISLEQTEKKQIIHCYGHGGAGYSTLFGTVYEALELFMRTNPSLEEPVKVIGSGCVGLTMAIELRQRGFTDVSISTKALYDIPSWCAGGFFEPGSGDEESPALLRKTRRALSTFLVYRHIEEGKHPYLTSQVIRRLPLYAPSEIKSGVEILEKLHYMPPREFVTLDFGNGVIHKNYAKFITYFIDVSTLMKQLWAVVDRLKIPVTIEEIRSFEDCNQNIICNCAGLEGGTLACDKRVYPLRGHFLLLNDLGSDAHMNYIIITQVSQEGKTENLCFFPKNCMHTSEYPDGIVCNGMFAGTSVLKRSIKSEEELQLIDAAELHKLASRAREFFCGKGPGC